jgi:hypothetical protein
MDQRNGMDAGKNISDESDGILDQRLYYYQTKAGTVSSSPLSVRQLIRLLCPVREGLNPILSSNTQCLTVVPVAQQNQNKQESSYGEWKAALEIDILREACCSNWFWTIEGLPAEGPGSCRKLLEVVSTHGDIENGKVMVFAKDITPEWTTISEMKCVQLVLRAIQNNKDNDNNSAEKDKKQISLGDPTETIDKINGGKQAAPDTDHEQIQNELEAFLSTSTGDSDVGGTKANKEQDVDDHLYESDGGTRYVKDPLSGNWIHEALAPKEISGKTNKRSGASQSVLAKTKPSSKKSKKAKFSKRNAKLWIYISGLPTRGVTTEDLQRYFSKAGLLDLDPETLQPKIKLYKDRSTGDLKGDASVCYARSESVELAIQILDNSLWDKDHCIKIERAQFQAKTQSGKNIPNGSTNQNEDGSNRSEYIKRKRPISEAQRKVVRLAILQAQDEGFGGRLTGGRKGLTIIVVKKIMNGIPEEKLEDVLYESFQKFGSIEKITCISKTRVVIVKYVEPIAASTALQALNGSPNPRTKEKIEAIYWDGVTDYTTVPGDEQKEKEEEERRHEEFGSWLESQEELPPEFQLQVAQD